MEGYNPRVDLSFVTSLDPLLFGKTKRGKIGGGGQKLLTGIEKRVEDVEGKKKKKKNPIFDKHDF